MFISSLKDNSLKEWSFKKAITIQTYTSLNPIPVPLNLVSSLVMGVFWLCKKCIGKFRNRNECRGGRKTEDVSRVSYLKPAYKSPQLYIFCACILQYIFCHKYIFNNSLVYIFETVRHVGQNRKKYDASCASYGSY